RGDADRGCPRGTAEGPHEDGHGGGHDQCTAHAHRSPSGNQLAELEAMFTPEQRGVSRDWLEGISEACR
ncbi:hypothetical protein, partial [Pseudonocardia sp.]|uniref:hypothetical protein n=1 Tax=Pseudonocardia sp. TaxID=60912 RepID=UPI0031FC839F